uniref:RNA-dependent RNA polymerase n=1 Tax=Triticum urartu TaxID=4572 RepID=A0A8R7RD97_TRIUA
MHELAEMWTNREATLSALSILAKIGSVETKTSSKMLLQGYEYPLMIFKAHQDNRLTNIRSRCKIHVPKGRVLIGCLDETDGLEYGQVYIRITKNSKEQKENGQVILNGKEKTTIVIGKVAIKKNPCLHPGDIRVLEAVYEHGAKNLVDCAVFPQRGERPHPNECSGGDLDRDLYFITWDEKLIPEKVDTPMEYTGARPPIMDHVVTLESIQKFFVNYMINDSPGAISTAHLIHANRHPMKVRSPGSLQLAAWPSQELQLKCPGHCDQGSTQISWNGGTNQCISPMELSARCTEQLRVVCRALLLSCPLNRTPHSIRTWWSLALRNSWNLQSATTCTWPP